jgi:hypothetical protein
MNIFAILVILIIGILLAGVILAIRLGRKKGIYIWDLSFGFLKDLDTNGIKYHIEGSKKEFMDKFHDKILADKVYTKSFKEIKEYIICYMKENVKIED